MKIAELLKQLHEEYNLARSMRHFESNIPLIAELIERNIAGNNNTIPSATEFEVELIQGIKEYIDCVTVRNILVQCGVIGETAACSYLIADKINEMITNEEKLKPIQFVVPLTYTITPYLRYAKKEIPHYPDTFSLELRLQQMWQGSDGTVKWEWVEEVDLEEIENKAIKKY